MATLTNSYHNCEILNLGYGPGGRGPFIVRQEASAPGSMTLQLDRFLLRKDGTWVLNLAVFALTEKEKEDFLYENTGAVVALLSELAGDPLVDTSLPEGTSIEKLKAAAQSTITGLWGKISRA
ncbi:hypothetical protein [Verrucomicrobium sp. BvORR034]|jgi:hypothetical protein|uniref:hypothetical protein n=1 Tax=Verrucomicrobium sp. BvORR034 TaxID=1396418 RepID=UPI0006795921|nr:hypothetical protein [Verrucomicrobium sp. BvORR034]